MRKLTLTAASAAALAIVATGAEPASAQVVVTSGYYSTPGYYVTPSYYGGGYAPVYRGGYTTGYGGFPTQPLVGTTGYGYPGSYGGYRTYSGYSNYGGYRPAYTSGNGGYRSYGGMSYGGRRG